MKRNPFIRLGLPENPVLLVPLAGVSDHPFRRICQLLGADLSYVEMISAAALVYYSKKTLNMLHRHNLESILGVQVTARHSEEMAKGIDILNTYPFDTIDINMGCPVRKVVKSGGGSAILKDPERVYRTTKVACQHTDKPISVKIRLGWDHHLLTYHEVAKAAQEGGAQWLTVHGRTRNDTYQKPVDLAKIAEIKAALDIPVIGNGNIFSKEDADIMKKKTQVDGLMISRGALGNPWIFREVKGKHITTNLDDWLQIVAQHISWQSEAYGDQGIGTVCMRKHLLWYVSGWPHARKVREKINEMQSLARMKAILVHYVQQLRDRDVYSRSIYSQSHRNDTRFLWNPVRDMNRYADRGVGEDGL